MSLDFSGEQVKCVFSRRNWGERIGWNENIEREIENQRKHGREPKISDRHAIIGPDFTLLTGLYNFIAKRHGLSVLTGLYVSDICPSSFN